MCLWSTMCFWRWRTCTSWLLSGKLNRRRKREYLNLEVQFSFTKMLRVRRGNNVASHIPHIWPCVIRTAQTIVTSPHWMKIFPLVVPGTRCLACLKCFPCSITPESNHPHQDNDPFTGIWCAWTGKHLVYSWLEDLEHCDALETSFLIILKFGWVTCGRNLVSAEWKCGRKIQCFRTFYMSKSTSY